MDRSLTALLGASLLLIGCASGRDPVTAVDLPEESSTAPVDANPDPVGPTPAARFEERVLPILEAGCSPCHFEGGKVYDQLPFDRPETIVRLGTRLFSRIKDEQDQGTIRSFLETSPADAGAPRSP